MLGPTEKVQYKNLVKTDGRICKKFSAEPFTGQVEGKKQGYLKKGKWDGIFVEIYSADKIKEKGEIKNDKREGPWVFYKYYGAVNKARTGTYRNGVKIK